MKIVQISGAVFAALALAACGANSKHVSAPQRAAEHAEEEKRDAQHEAREAREDAENEREEAREATLKQRVAEQEAQWAAQRAAQAEAEAARDARPQPRMGTTERQADYAAFKSSVQFAPNSAELSADAKAKLDDVAKQAQGRNVIVQGFADNTGPDAVNVELSRRRADAVSDYLEHQGIARDRIATRGMGAREPANGQDTERGRALNRRVEIIIQAAAR
jgi:outer membrane protein OmpA-like peptidoglycan-associated protein